MEETLHGVEVLLPVILLLLAGIVAATCLKRIGVSAIVGYLLAGIVIGPQGFGIIEESETTRLLAELGVVFLLFDIGLHFSMRRMWQTRRDIFGLGPVQMAVCALAFAGIGLAAGLDTDVAIVAGAALALSSTAVAVQTLADNGQQRCPVGQSATAVLIFQDLCAIFLLILANSLGGDQGSLAAELGRAALNAALAAGAAMIIGRYLIGPLFDWLARSDNEEVYTATAVLIVLVTAAATGALGLSLTLGAFLAGMIIAETKYRHAIQTEAKPFRGLLLSFFFITVGMGLELDVLMGDWARVLAVLGLLLGIKIVAITVVALVLRAPLARAVQLGLILSQGSEFAFVILSMGPIRDALGADTVSIVIAAIAASLAVTPFLGKASVRVGVWLARRQGGDGAAAAPATEDKPFLVLGMGEVGRTLADALFAFDLPFVAVERDPDRFGRATGDGYPVSFGDGTDLRLLETLGIRRAAGLAVTIPRYEVSQAISPLVRQQFPNLVRYVAVDLAEDEEKFRALGLRPVVCRTTPAGLELAALILTDAGIAENRIAAWMRDEQDRFLAAGDGRTRSAA
ncbi:MAG: cation:proton antiporter domain-containing protein [Inquilinaceae bacterium]